MLRMVKATCNIAHTHSFKFMSYEIYIPRRFMSYSKGFFLFIILIYFNVLPQLSVLYLVLSHVAMSYILHMVTQNLVQNMSTTYHYLYGHS